MRTKLLPKRSVSWNRRTRAEYKAHVESRRRFWKHQDALQRQNTRMSQGASRHETAKRRFQNRAAQRGRNNEAQASAGSRPFTSDALTSKRHGAPSTERRVDWENDAATLKTSNPRNNIEYERLIDNLDGPNRPHEPRVIPQRICRRSVGSMLYQR
jgi:hypothetical protein